MTRDDSLQPTYPASPTHSRWVAGRLPVTFGSGRLSQLRICSLTMRFFCSGFLARGASMKKNAPSACWGIMRIKSGLRAKIKYAFAQFITRTNKMRIPARWLSASSRHFARCHPADNGYRRFLVQSDPDFRATADFISKSNTSSPQRALQLQFRVHKMFVDTQNNITATCKILKTE